MHDKEHLPHDRAPHAHLGPACRASRAARGTAIVLAALALVPGIVVCAAPPAIPRPETLVGVGPAFPQLGRPLGFYEVLSGPEILDVQGSASLERVVGWDLGRRQVAAGGASERLFSAFWFADPLATLEARPLLGRSFLADEITSRAKVAMLSEGAWRRLLGGDPAAIGGTLQVEGEPYTVIGILPAALSIYRTDLWLPMWAAAAELPRERRQFQLVARIRPGQTIAGVNAELAEIARRVEATQAAAHAEYAGWKLEARSWDEVVRERAGGR